MRSKVVLLVVSVVFVGATVAVLFAIPRAGNQPETTPLAPETSGAVDVILTVDSIDAASGSMRMRLLAAPGEHLPPDGGLLLTSVGQIPSITVAPDRLNQEQGATVLFQKGDVVDYPFETYKATVQLVAIRGTDPNVPQNTTRPRLAISGVFATNAAGFSITPQSHIGKDDIANINFVIRRTLGTRGWVLAMMAIYWALALGAAAVTALVIRRKRMWESRMLAWLGAMLFALVTFRAAAPGSPPVGTFLDYFAMFEAVGVVAVSLAVLIVYYLVQPPEALNLTPPQNDRR